MSNRYQTLSWVTGTVNAGSTLTGDQTVGPSLFNIVKIKIVPDSGSETFNFRIYKDAARTKRLIRFEQQVPNLYQPVDRTAGLPGVEMYEGVPFPYDDDDATGKLHWEFVNNGVSNHTFTVTVLYEEVPLMDASGNATYRGSVSYPSVTTATIYGGTAAGSTLTLAGTSNGSPANAHILLNPTSQGKVGIGTAGPTQALDVRAALAGVNVQSTTGTNAAFTSYANTSGFLYIGVDSSAGATLLAGSTGYAGIITNTGANPLQFGTNNVVRLTISSAGVATFNSTGQFVRLGLGAAADANHLLVVSSAAGGFGLKVLDASGTSGVPVLNLSTTATSSGNLRNWMIGANYDVVGDFTIRQSTAEGSDPYAGGATKFRINRGGSVILAPGGALATNATDGFSYLPSSAGAPTGTPTTVTGAVPCEIDTTNNKFMANIGGTWKGVTLT